MIVGQRWRWKSWDLTMISKTYPLPTRTARKMGGRDKPRNLANTSVERPQVGVELTGFIGDQFAAKIGLEIDAF